MTPREIVTANIEFRSDGVAPEAIEALRARCRDLRIDGGALTVETDDLPATMEALLAWSRQHGVAVDNLIVRQPNLEDVFLSLTGRRLRE